jgi:tRNA U54 and U55 pseudouridine synthase Pus10
MNENNEFKSLEISGVELDRFVKNLVDKLYHEIWSDISIGHDEVIIKERLNKSIIAALEEYAGYRADGK